MLVSGHALVVAHKRLTGPLTTYTRPVQIKLACSPSMEEDRSIHALSLADDSCCRERHFLSFLFFFLRVWSLDTLCPSGWPCDQLHTNINN